MISYYHINGKLVPAGEAALKVNDLAILRGYGIFDYFLIREGQPLFLEDYLDRFFRSAELLHLKPPQTRDQLHRHIGELMEANGETDGGMRLLLTGGYVDDGYNPVAPNLLIMQYPLSRAPEAFYEKGIKLITYQHQRELPEVKSINYLMGIRLIPEVRSAGALEPLYHDGTYLREAVRSNFFLVTADGRLVTPASKILFGITRRKVLEAVRGHFEVEEREVRLEELHSAQEAFLTGSNKLVMPVVQVDDIVFGNGRPGPVTRKIMELLEAYTMDYLSAAAALDK